MERVIKHTGITWESFPWEVKYDQILLLLKKSKFYGYNETKVVAKTFINLMRQRDDIIEADKMKALAYMGAFNGEAFSNISYVAGLCPFVFPVRGESTSENFNISKYAHNIVGGARRKKKPQKKIVHTERLPTVSVIESGNRGSYTSAIIMPPILSMSLVPHGWNENSFINLVAKRMRYPFVSFNVKNVNSAIIFAFELSKMTGIDRFSVMNTETFTDMINGMSPASHQPDDSTRMSSRGIDIMGAIHGRRIAEISNFKVKDYIEEVEIPQKSFGSEIFGVAYQGDKTRNIVLCSMLEIPGFGNQTWNEQLPETIKIDKDCEHYKLLKIYNKNIENRGNRARLFDLLVNGEDGKKYCKLCNEVIFNDIEVQSEYGDRFVASEEMLTTKRKHAQYIVKSMTRDRSIFTKPLFITRHMDEIIDGSIAVYKAFHALHIEGYERTTKKKIDEDLAKILMQTMTFIFIITYVKANEKSIQIFESWTKKIKPDRYKEARTPYTSFTLQLFDILFSMEIQKLKFVHKLKLETITSVKIQQFILNMFDYGIERSIDFIQNVLLKEMPGSDDTEFVEYQLTEEFPIFMDVCGFKIYPKIPIILNINPYEHSYYNYHFFCINNSGLEHKWIDMDSYSKTAKCGRCGLVSSKLAIERQSVKEYSEEETDKITETISAASLKYALINFHKQYCTDGSRHNIVYDICYNCGLTFDEIVNPEEGSEYYNEIMANEKIYRGSRTTKYISVSQDHIADNASYDELYELKLEELHNIIYNTSNKIISFIKGEYSSKILTYLTTLGVCSRYADKKMELGSTKEDMQEIVNGNMYFSAINIIDNFVLYRVIEYADSTHIKSMVAHDPSKFSFVISVLVVRLVLEKIENADLRPIVITVLSNLYNASSFHCMSRFDFEAEKLESEDKIRRKWLKNLSMTREQKIKLGIADTMVSILDQGELIEDMIKQEDQLFELRNKIDTTKEDDMELETSEETKNDIMGDEGFEQLGEHDAD